MSLNLSITADSNYGIVGTISSNIATEITVNVTGTSLAQLITGAVAYTSYDLTWNNQGGFAGYFLPGNTYSVYGSDSAGNSVTGAVTLPSPTLTLAFTTGTAYASVSLSALNGILGTTYGSMTRTWDALAGSNIYVLSTTTALSQTIKASAFQGQNPTYLKSIKDYGTVVSVGSYAFLGANQLTSAIMPYTTVFGNSVFENCVALTTINIASLTTAGTQVFAGLDPIISSITMRGSTSTQAIFGTVPTARFIPTYLIGTDTFPSALLSVDKVVVNTGTTVQVQTSATNLPDGFVFTASIYSKLLKGFYNTTTFAPMNAGTAIGSMTIPEGIPNTDTVYIVYDYSRSAFPVNPVNFNGNTKLYTAATPGAPQSYAIQVVPNVITYTTPVTADTYYTVSYGSPTVPLPLNVTGVYNTASILTPLLSSEGLHTGTVSLAGGNTVIQYQPDAIFNGPDNFRFSVIGANGQTSNSSTVYITVTAPTIAVAPSTITTPRTNVGARFINTFTASGGTGPYTIELASGYIPPGLTLSPSTAATAVLTGTATLVGTYNFSIKATDSSYPVSTGTSAQYTIQVFPAAPDALATTFAIGEGSTARSVPLNFSSTPATVSIVTAPTHGTAVASGANITYQPTAGYSGIDSFTFRGANVSGLGSTGTATITVTSSTVVFSLATGTQLISGIVKKPYAGVTLGATGGYGNYTFSAVGLPTGMTLTNATFSGTPTVVGIFNPIITVHDSGTPNLYSTTTYVLDILSGPTTIGANNFDTMQQAASGIAQLLYNLYNTTPYSSPVVAGQPILASDWTNLYNDIERCYIHQHGAGQVDIPIATAGTKVLALTTASLMPKITSLISNFTAVGINQLNAVSVFYTTATTTSTVGGLNFTWPDVASANAFFNLGGYIKSTFNDSVFTLTNYSASTFNVVTGTIQTITGGSQQIFIEGSGNSITFVVDIVANPTGTPISASGNITYYVSKSDNGGVAATPPFIQVVTNNLGPVFTAPKILFVYGNNLTNSSILVENQGLVYANILSVSPIHDPNYPEQLTFSYDLTGAGGGTLAGGQSGAIAISWQNNNENGGRGFYVNYVRIQYSTGPGNVQTVIVPTTVQTFFGIKPIAGVPIYHVDATTNYFIPYTFKGYGGVLDTNYGINPSVATWGRGFKVASYGPSYFKPNDPPITIELDTNKVPNNSTNQYTSTVATFIGKDTYGEYSTTSTVIALHVASKDQNISSWISAQNANNGVIGMSYDILNGQRCLTIGFGMGGGYSDQLILSKQSTGYDTYSKHAIKQLSNKFQGIPANYLRYNGTSTNITPFLNDYGVWKGSSEGNNVVSETYAFMVRNSYDYYFQADATSPASFTIAGNNYGVNFSQTINVPGNVTVNGSVTLQPGYYTITINCTDSTSYRPSVGFRLYDHYLPGLNALSKFQDGSNVWSTLETIIPVWSDISRIYLNMDGNPVTYQQTSDIITSGIASGVPYRNFFSNQSMFSITHDGYGNLTINVNGVDHLSGEAIVDQTLINVAYLMYYYSNYEPSAGFNDRYNNIGGNSNDTPYFKGFDSSGNVVTTTLPTPAALPPGTTSDPNLLFAASVILETIQLVRNIQNGFTINQSLGLSGSIFLEEGVQTSENLLLLGESAGSLPLYYVDIAALALTVLGANDPTAKALSDAYMAISAVGVAATALSSVGIGVVAAAEGVSFFTIGIEVLFGTGFFCFTGDTKVKMADGTTKSIMDIAIGDMVVNHDGTQVNTVTFVIDSVFTGKLYSPIDTVEAFGSWQHPMMIDGKLSSYDPTHTAEHYKWLGDAEQIVPANSIEVENTPLYNLLVDGDGTYTVNDIGTTSVIGDGGAIVKAHNRGLISRDIALSVLRKYHEAGGTRLHLFHLANKLLEKLL